MDIDKSNRLTNSIQFNWEKKSRACLNSCVQISWISFSFCFGRLLFHVEVQRKSNMHHTNCNENLHSDRFILLVFIFCECESMYYIYSTLWLHPHMWIDSMLNWKLNVGILSRVCLCKTRSCQLDETKMNVCRAIFLKRFNAYRIWIWISGTRMSVWNRERERERVGELVFL